MPHHWRLEEWTPQPEGGFQLYLWRFYDDRANRGDYLFQVAGGKARRVQVEKITESGGYTGITGLTDLSLPVVTVGNYELHDGMPVRDTGP